MRGKYRQFILRVTADNKDEIVSADIPIALDKTLELSVEMVSYQNMSPSRNNDIIDSFSLPACQSALNDKEIPMVQVVLILVRGHSGRTTAWMVTLSTPPHVRDVPHLHSMITTNFAVAALLLVLAILTKFVVAIEVGKDPSNKAVSPLPRTAGLIPLFARIQIESRLEEVARGIMAGGKGLTHLCTMIVQPLHVVPVHLYPRS